MTISTEQTRSLLNYEEDKCMEEMTIKRNLSTFVLLVFVTIFVDIPKEDSHGDIVIERLGAQYLTEELECLKCRKMTIIEGVDRELRGFVSCGDVTVKDFCIEGI